LTNEKAYLLGKFARVALGTPHIDYNGRYCMSSAAAAANRAFGIDRGLPFPVADLADTETLVLWGANPADTMPPLMTWVERRRGALVVVDPRRTATAAVADQHLQPVPGSDMAVALGLLRLAWDTDVVDEKYLRARTRGWEEVRDSLGEWTPEEVERHSGISPAELRGLLQALAQPASAILLTGRGPEQQSKGVDTVGALINLMLALGRVGKPASGWGCLTGQANGQGGREHGQKADQLPGYRSIDGPLGRAHVARIWGIRPDELPGAGLSAVEMLAGIGSPGGIRAMVVVGSDVASASPDANQVAARLRSLETLAVLDSYMTATADLAGFVLPVAVWAEEEGTLTNLEGRVLRRRRAVSPPEGVRDDLQVLCALAARLGHAGQFSYSGAEGVYDELRLASAGGPADYSGITYARLDAPGGRSGPGIAWPCPTSDHPGTPRLFESRFAHPDGRARMVAVAWRPSAEAPDAEFPVWFTTGRLREHYNTGGQTRRIPSLLERAAEPFLQMHPLLARRVGCVDGEPVLAESRRGRARFRCRVSADIRPDTVFAPFHWGGETCANLLTSPALDPISRMPEFKVCAVRLVAGE
ncbi:MAG: molybdopterin oxidoreductase family protein, partial [Acidimicrobiales bacterium]